ncbi:MAG: hypothetical protein M5R40_15755 [Anaerolineae bacterium]|nr:hypothetical protein [Anaerolineae bacterium]
MRRLLAGLEPYLILMENEGVFQFLDPVTLETAVRLQVGTAWAYPTGFNASYDGQRFYFGQHTGPTFEQRAVDLATPANCRLTQAGNAVMENVYGDRLLVQSQEMAVAAWDADTLVSVRTVYTGSDAGARLFPSDELTWVYMVRSHESDAELTAFDMRTLDFAPYSEAVRLSPVNYGPLTGAWDTRLPYFYLSDGERLFHVIVYTHDLETATTLALDPVADTLVRAEIAGAHNGSVFMYYPVGGYRIDALFAQREGAAPGGVFVVNANTGQVRQRWHEGLAFAQVIRGGDHLYALQAAADGSATVYGMALADGEIVATRDLPPGAWTLAYAHLDPGLLAAAGASTALDCPTVEPTLVPTLAAMPPATATPAPQ